MRLTANPRAGTPKDPIALSQNATVCYAQHIELECHHHNYHCYPGKKSPSQLCCIGGFKGAV